MKADGKLKINRQELRRDARRNPLTRCPVCGKTSTRCNKAVHDKAKAKAGGK